MRRREEKRQKFHEALLQTLYPSSSPSSPSSSPSPVDDEPFDVTLINPEDYVRIGSSNNGDDSEIGDGNGDGDESGTGQKPSRAKRKRLRKKMLKEEAARRKGVIGPLLPTGMSQFSDERDANASGSNGEEDESDVEEEASSAQGVRPNAHEKEGKVSVNIKTRKMKKRREAKKLLAKESSNPLISKIQIRKDS